MAQRRRSYEKQFGYSRAREEHEEAKAKEAKRLEWIEKGYFPKRKEQNVAPFKVGG
jgi:hypothetical protein